MDDSKEEVQVRVASYLRVSTEDQVEKYGLDAQREAIDAYIKSRGTFEDKRPKMVHAGKAYEYVDDGISGTTELNKRPAFSLLQDDIANSFEGRKPFDTVITFKLDRFARKLTVLMDILKFFEESKLQFASVTENIDTSTPFGRAMIGIMGVIAELELENIHARTSLGRQQAILDGHFMGTHPPFGYTKDDNKRLKILEPEAKYVRQIFDLFTIEKLSPQKIADMFTEAEIWTPEVSAIKYNKRKKSKSRRLNSPTFWRLENVRTILSNQIYTGKQFYEKTKKRKKILENEWKLSPYKHKPIILENIFEFAQQRLSDFSARKVLTKKKEQGHIYLLSGLLKCDYCKNLASTESHEMMSWTGDKKMLTDKPLVYSYYYKCNRKNRKKFTDICTVVPMPAKPIEIYVLNFVKELLNDPQAVYDYQRDLASNRRRVELLETAKERFEERFNSIPKRRISIQEQHEMGLFDTPTLKKKVEELNKIEKELQEKISQLDHQLSKYKLSEGYAVSIQKYSEKYGKAFDKILKDEQELHDLIHDLVHQIVVYSRPITAKDKIAGRKRPDQAIPNSIDIYLNLPQNLLRSLYRTKFGVRTDNVWGHRDSNPEPTT